MVIEDTEAKKRKLGKNPGIDTTYLPDRDRELAELAERERLKQEWENEQQKMKEQTIKVTYSYWDGAGKLKEQRASYFKQPSRFRKGRYGPGRKAVV